jgi:hypothetical protein
MIINLLNQEKHHLQAKIEGVYPQSIKKLHGYHAANHILQQNGVVERKNQTIVEAAKAVLNNQDLPMML